MNFKLAQDLIATILVSTLDTNIMTEPSIKLAIYTHTNAFKVYLMHIYSTRSLSKLTNKQHISYVYDAFNKIIWR